MERDEGEREEEEEEKKEPARPEATGETDSKQR